MSQPWACRDRERTFRRWACGGAPLLRTSNSFSEGFFMPHLAVGWFNYHMLVAGATSATILKPVELFCGLHIAYAERRPATPREMTFRFGEKPRCRRGPGFLFLLSRALLLCSRRAFPYRGTRRCWRGTNSGGGALENRPSRNRDCTCANYPVYPSY
jgi:hypothetical protein